MRPRRLCGNPIKDSLIGLAAQEMHARIKRVRELVGQASVAFRRPHLGGGAGRGVHDDGGTGVMRRLGKQLSRSRGGVRGDTKLWLPAGNRPEWLQRFEIAVNHRLAGHKLGCRQPREQSQRQESKRPAQIDDQRIAPPQQFEHQPPHPRAARHDQRGVIQPGPIRNSFADALVAFQQ